MLVDAIAARVADRPVTVVSPDIGGARRAEKFARSLSAALDRSVPVAFLEKRRSDNVISGGETVIGDVDDRVAVLVDDLISSGGTLVRAAESCHRQGATAVFAAATHGAFTIAAADTFAGSRIDALFVTDTVTGRTTPERTTVLPIAPMLADVIRRLHEGGSLVDLQEGRP